MDAQRRGLAIGLLAAGLAVREAAAAPRTVEASMGDRPMTFLPAALRIRAGDTVIWRNPALTTHTVTCDPAVAKSPGAVRLPAGAAVFDSGPLEQGDAFSFTFTVKGVYRYVCRYHQAMGMAGTVVVS